MAMNTLSIPSVNRELARPTTRDQARLALEQVLLSSDRKESKLKYAHFEKWDFGALNAMEMVFSAQRVQDYVRRDKNNYTLTVQQTLATVKRMYNARSINSFRELAQFPNEERWPNWTWSFQEFERCMVAFLFIIIDHAVTADDGHTPGTYDKALAAVLSGIGAYKGRTEKRFSR